MTHQKILKMAVCAQIILQNAAYAHILQMAAYTKEKNPKLCDLIAFG